MILLQPMPKPRVRIQRRKRECAKCGAKPHGLKTCNLCGCLLCPKHFFNHAHETKIR